MTDSKKQSLTWLPPGAIPDHATATRIDEALAPTFREIDEVNRRFGRRVLGDAYRIGSIIERDWLKFLEADKEGRIFRFKVWDTFAESVGYCARALRTYHDFYKKCDKDEVEQFATAQLTWTHVRKLIEFDQETRSQWFEKIVHNKWNADQFLRECSREQGKQEARSVRKPAKPRNVKQGIERLTRSIEKQQRLFDEALFCPEFDLPSEISFLSPGECTNEFHDHISETIKVLREFTDTTRERLIRIEGSFRHVQQTIGAREAANGVEKTVATEKEDAYA